MKQCTRVAVNALRIYNLLYEFSGRELLSSAILRSVTVSSFTSSVRNSFHHALHALAQHKKHYHFTTPTVVTGGICSCLPRTTFYDVIASGHDLPWCVVKCDEQN